MVKQIQRCSLTKSQLLSHIRALVKAGNSLKAKDNPELLEFAKKYFNTWRSAIDAAGVLTQYRASMVQKWTKGKIVKIIIRDIGYGLPMSAGSIKIRNCSLSRGIRHVFNGWENAFQYTLSQSAKVRRKISWSKKRVIQTICREMKSGLPMNLPSIRKRNWILYYAFQQHFDTWPDALAEAKEMFLGKK